MISIIIPSRFNVGLATVCLDSIKLYTKNYELILIQEGEDPELTDLLTDRADEFIHHKEPKGYSASLNAGAKKAKGEYLVFMNNDTAVTPNWLEEMLSAFDLDKEDDQKVGIVSPTFLYSHTTRQSPIWGQDKRYEQELNPMNFVGVCYLMRKSVFKKVGGWDESFFFGGEDMDMAMRVAKDHRLIIARNSYIYHYIGASAQKILQTPEQQQAKKLEIARKLEAKHNIKLL